MLIQTTTRATTRTLALLGIAALMLVACKDRESVAPVVTAPAPAPATMPASAPSPAPAPASAAPAGPDSWLGKWTGPEGTSLTLAREGSKYNIAIRSLDGLASYEGTAAGDHIEFMRNGPESIRAGNGKDTGMKWLADKSDCLYIKAGEGFCKD